MSSKNFHRQALLHTDWETFSDLESEPILECLIVAIQRQFDPAQAFGHARLFFVNGSGRPYEIGEGKLLVREGGPQAFTRVVEEARLIPFPTLPKSLGLVALFIGERRIYRELIDIAGPELATRLLLQAHELAALQASRPASRILAAVRRDRAFDKIVTSDEERFALLSFKQLVDERAVRRRFPPDIVEIEAVVPFARNRVLPVRVVFPEALGAQQPIAVVIGPNGAGKTRLLLGLAHELLRGTARIKTRSAESEPSPLKLVSFTYEKALWRRAKNAGVKVISMGVTPSNWLNLGPLLRSLAMGSPSGFDLAALCLVLEPAIDPGEVHLPTAHRTRWDAEAPLPSVTLKTLAQFGRDHLLTELDASRPVFMYSKEKGRFEPSSGQRSIMLFATELFAETSDGALVFVDEPENHLHPQFVSVMMQALRRALSARESRAVVVTHSPFVVREVDSSAVRVLQTNGEGEPALFRTSLQTLGADVSAISDHVFGDLKVKKAYEIRIDELMHQAPDNEARRRVVEQVAEEAGGDAELYARLKAER